MHIKIRGAWKSIRILPVIQLTVLKIGVKYGDALEWNNELNQ